MLLRLLLIGLKGFLPLAFLLALMFYWLHLTLARPVGQVEIFGEVRHTNLQALQENALPWLEAPFWQVDLAGLQAALEADPWLRHVEVTRRWPDTVHLQLHEQRVWATWNDRALLNDAGEPFYPPNPLDFPTGRLLYVEQENLQDAVALWRSVEALGGRYQFILTRMQLEPRGAWQLELNGAVRVLMGRDNIEGRMNRFLWAWQTWLHEQQAELKQVDLRYPNGLTVTRY